MGDAMFAAIRHFPEYREVIEVLSARDPGFKGLCEDLGEAEAALSSCMSSPSNDRSELQAEYEALVVELTGELGAILKKIAMAPMLCSKRKRQAAPHHHRE
jgi:hypothetical protein